MDKIQLSNEINNLSLPELQDVLKEIKLYKTLEKQLGERGKKLFASNKNGSDCTAAMMPISPGPASSKSTATMGTAANVSCSAD